MKPYFEDDFVTLYHGDCLEHSELWTVADVLVTDPPYGIGYASGKMTNGRGSLKTKIHGDRSITTRDEALFFWGTKPAMVFGSWKIARPVETKHRLIWHKTKALPGMRNDSQSPWFGADEEIYILGTGWIGKSRQNVYPTATRQDGSSGLVAQVGHPTPKPVGLMEQLIEKCQPEWVIADPFAGSGATLIAARNLGRRVIGFEIEEKYCELIVKRLSQQAFDFEGI